MSQPRLARLYALVLLISYVASCHQHPRDEVRVKEFVAAFSRMYEDRGMSLNKDYSLDDFDAICRKYELRYDIREDSSLLSISSVRVDEWLFTKMLFHRTANGFRVWRIFLYRRIGKSRSFLVLPFGIYLGASTIRDVVRQLGPPSQKRTLLMPAGKERWEKETSLEYEVDMGGIRPIVSVIFSFSFKGSLKDLLISTLPPGHHTI